MEKYLLTVTEVMEYTGIGRDRLYALIRSGQLPHISIGKYKKVHRLELEKFLDDAAKQRAQL